MVERFFGPSRRRSSPDPLAEYQYAAGMDADSSHFIVFRHISSTQHAIFRAFLTKFSDSFSCNWNEQQALYRTDPIPIYQNTNRKISLGFKVVSSGPEDLNGHVAEVQKLQSFLYPEHDVEAAAPSQISGAPVVGIKFINLISDPDPQGRPDFLHGYIKNLNVNFVHESGFITGRETAAVREVEVGADRTDFEIFEGPEVFGPQEIDVSFDFTVLHRPGLGANGERNNASAGYKIRPGGADKLEKDPGLIYYNRYWPYGMKGLPSQKVTVLLPGQPGTRVQRSQPPSADDTPGPGPRETSDAPPALARRASEEREFQFGFGDDSDSNLLA